MVTRGKGPGCRKVQCTCEKHTLYMHCAWIGVSGLLKTHDGTAVQSTFHLQHFSPMAMVRFWSPALSSNSCWNACSSRQGSRLKRKPHQAIHTILCFLLVSSSCHGPAPLTQCTAH